MTALYRVLAAIGFTEPTINGRGMPTIAWPDTKTGVTMPAEEPPAEWDTVGVEATELRVANVVVERLLQLRRDPAAAQRASTVRQPAAGRRDAGPAMDELTAGAFYRLLKHCGFPRPVVNAEGMPTIAWPQTRSGITFAADTGPLGWTTAVIEPKELAQLAELLSRLTLLHVGHRMRTSGATATRRISSDEQEMLSALLRHGVPEPDRNFSVRDDNDKFRGVADFAWETINGDPVKVALEVDGWHWHVGRDMAEEIAAMAGSDRIVARKLQQTVRAKGAVDAAKRRVLQLRGWQVIVVHDTEITPANVDAIAADIKAAIDGRRKEEVVASTSEVDGDEF